MFPTYKDIRTPLLAEILVRGGVCSPRDEDLSGRNVYDKLADYFGLTLLDREATTAPPQPNQKPENKWENMVRWARNDLKKLGLLGGSVRGIWDLTIDGQNQAEQIISEEVASGSFAYERAVTPEELETNLKKAKEIGDLGEKHVFEHEINQLISVNKQNLAAEVKHVARENIACGYDILSFTEDGMPKYIEVKSTTSESKTFYLSDNERRKSEFYGDAYWIYRVTKVETEHFQIQKFRNPAAMIANGQIQLIPVTYKAIFSENS